MTILASEAPASATSPWSDAAELDVEVREQQLHAMTVQYELIGLLQVPPMNFAINSHRPTFHGRFGVVIEMGLAVTNLFDARSLLGGEVLIEAEIDAYGFPFLRHTLTGTRAGVPFMLWTMAYPASPAVAA